MDDYLVAIGILSCTGVMLLGLPPLLRRFPAAHNLARAITHLMSAVLASVAVLLVDSRPALVTAGILAVPFLILCVELRWFGPMLHGSRVRDYGFVGYAAGFTILVALLFTDQTAIIAGLATLGVADPAASIVGRRLGRVRIQVWRSARSLEGSLAFAGTAWVVLTVVLWMSTGRLDWSTMSIAGFIAFTAAAVEALAPSALDNLLIPVWVGVLVHLVTAADVSGSPMWLSAILVSAVAAVVSAWLRWLDLPAAIGAFLVGAVALGLGGWAWLTPLVVFLATTSVLSKLPPKGEDHGPRGLEQTMVNGLAPVLPVLGHAWDGRAIWYFLFIGAVAVANADTWASEIGRRIGGTPRSLRTLGRVPPGTSGAVTVAGTGACLVGGLLIGSSAAIFSPDEAGQLIGLSVVVGFVGTYVDTFLGAWAQCRYVCVECGARQERARHCGRPGLPVMGVPGFTNERVNLAANLLGAVAALMWTQLM